jgi:hypothetical protein
MKKYDVFISYAIEDKHTIAAPIASGLKNSGLSVYFVGEELEPGSSVSNTIFDGLEQSSFCVPILSSYYIRQWPAIERRHILRREKKAGKPLVFPVWHHIEQEDVSRLFPELADHYAPTINMGIDAIVSHLQAAITKRKRQDALRYWRNAVLMAGTFFLTVLILYKVTENRTGAAPVIHHDNYATPDH